MFDFYCLIIITAQLFIVIFNHLLMNEFNRFNIWSNVQVYCHISAEVNSKQPVNTHTRVNYVLHKSIVSLRTHVSVPHLHPRPSISISKKKKKFLIEINSIANSLSLRLTMEKLQN